MAGEFEVAGKFEFDDAFVSAVIRASDGPERELLDAVERYGPRAVARLLVEEVIARAAPPANETAVLVRLELRHGDEILTHHLRVSRESGVSLAEAGDGFVGMRVAYELGELARELYGPLRERTAGVRGTALFPDVSEESGFDSMGTYFLATQQATQAVLAGCGSDKPDLAELSSRYVTPKFGSLHWFTPHYDQHFRPYRAEQVRVLEIGIGGYRYPGTGGGSLKMWKHFFPRGLVYGLDIEDKSHIDEPRITALRGDQGDADSLRDIAERHGPFDIVIDDGSHLNEHVRTSFHALFPHVRPGGLYVVEDMWTAYWPGFGGDADPANSSGTSLGLLKSVIDAIQHEERPDSGRREPSYLERNVVGLHVYHNVAFVQKGRNDEGGVPPWMPRDFNTLVAASSGETLDGAEE